MRLKRFSRLSATLAMAAVLAPLSTVIMPTTATATSALTIWATSGANYDWQKTLIPGFDAPPASMSPTMFCPRLPSWTGRRPLRSHIALHTPLWSTVRLTARHSQPSMARRR